MDPEPGRCRRTDGKKWICSRDVVAGQKYCKRHVDRGRNRSRKPVENHKPFLPGGCSSGGCGLGLLDPSLLASQPLTRPSSHSSDILPLNQSAPKGKEGQVQQRERRPNWSKDEDEALCKAWLSISEDPATFTDDQLRTKLWDLILAEFNVILGWETERCSSGLMNRWSVIQSHLNKYSECVRKIQRNRTSRYNIEASIGAAKQLYYSSEGHHFKWDGCWLLLKDSPKWLTYRGKQELKKQKIANTNVEAFNVDLDQTIDSSTPVTTRSSKAGSGSLDDENPPFVKESHELPRLAGQKPAKKIRPIMNVDQLDAIKLFVAEFSNLRKEQKEIAEQEIMMLNRREELKIQAKQELERLRAKAKLEQEQMMPDYEQMRLEKEIMMTDPNLVPTEEGKAWIIAKQKAILARTLQGASSGSGILTSTV